MNEFQTILNETIERLLTDHVNREVIERAEEGTWPDALWTALEENGLTRLLVSEEQGGAGASWPDALLLLSAAGRHSAPVPFAETLVASWLLSEAGLSVPDGAITLLEGDLTLSGNTVSGALAHVPWGRHCAHGVAVIDDRVALASLEGAACEEQINIAREPRDHLTLTDAKAETAANKVQLSLSAWGSLMRSAQMAGALDQVMRQSVEYANDRKQFGKPIGKFQAIQQQLAVLATQSAAAGAIAAHACDRAGEADPEFEIAVAKTRIDDAVNIATGIAHQVHGAIGFTYEHQLHFSTRRLWSWRAEFGTGREWAAKIGRAALERGGDALWPDVTAR